LGGGILKQNQSDFEKWVDSVSEFTEDAASAFKDINKGYKHLMDLVGIHQDLLKSINKQLKGQTALLVEQETRIKELERVIKEDGMFNPSFIKERS
jgi:ABC-type transporter Mla subunit MlaD